MRSNRLQSADPSELRSSSTSAFCSASCGEACEDASASGPGGRFFFSVRCLWRSHFDGEFGAGGASPSSPTSMPPKSATKPAPRRSRSASAARPRRNSRVAGMVLFEIEVRHRCPPSRALPVSSPGHRRRAGNAFAAITSLTRIAAAGEDFHHAHQFAVGHRAVGAQEDVFVLAAVRPPSSDEPDRLA